MGIVYRAEHMETGRIAAVKTVLLRAEGMLQGIRREIRALARLRHHGVARIINEGVDHERPWYAMELLQGVSLRAYLRGIDPAHTEDQETQVAGPIRAATLLLSADAAEAAAGVRPRPPRVAAKTAAAALRLAKRLCSPLAFIHGEGIVHRDLKPENVLVTAGEQPVIIDFGLAAQFDGRLSLGSQETTGRVEGTPLYIAPEVLEGRLVDARADLYALGCMLYEMLGGRPPFEGDIPAIIRGHVLETPHPLSDLAPACPSPSISWWIGCSPRARAIAPGTPTKSPRR